MYKVQIDKAYPVKMAAFYYGFTFLLNNDYDGSDSQMGAARIILKMDKQLLQAKKKLLLQAQSNEVYWKRPFLDAKGLDRFFPAF